MDTCSVLMAFVGTSSLLGQKRCDNHLGDGYVRDLRCSAVYAYLTQGMVGIWPYLTQLTNGTIWRDVSWEQSNAEDSWEKMIGALRLELGFLGCSLVLMARMMGLHSYGYLNLKTNINARRNRYFSTVCYHRFHL